MLGWAELLVLMREGCEGWPEKEPAPQQGSLRQQHQALTGLLLSRFMRVQHQAQGPMAFCIPACQCAGGLDGCKGSTSSKALENTCKGHLPQGHREPL